jgi:hypothetical protein
VLDRFIQQIVLQVLQEDWDPSFSDASFGFRPGRSAHQAIARAQEYVKAGFTRVVCFAGRSKTVYQNDLINRTAVIRMPGGVGGGSREVSPYPDWQCAFIFDKIQLHPIEFSCIMIQLKDWRRILNDRKN